MGIGMIEFLEKVEQNDSKQRSAIFLLWGAPK